MVIKYLLLLKEKFVKLIKENDLYDEEVIVDAVSLNADDVTGNHVRREYSFIKGKEVLMQTVFKGSVGQAYTDMPGWFEGTISDVLSLKLESNYQRAVFIATLNAVARYLEVCDKTIHCKNEEQKICGKELVKYINKTFVDPKVCLIGLQPTLLDYLARDFEVRVLDLDLDSIGTEKYGVLVEDGELMLENALEWCDVVISTGSTIVNNTLMNYIDKKPVVFYGTTIAGASCLLGLKRFCYCAT